MKFGHRGGLYLYVLASLDKYATGVRKVHGDDCVCFADGSSERWDNESKAKEVYRKHPLKERDLLRSLSLLNEERRNNVLKNCKGVHTYRHVIGQEPLFYEHN